MGQSVPPEAIDRWGTVHGRRSLVLSAATACLLLVGLLSPADAAVRWGGYERVQRGTLTLVTTVVADDGSATAVLAAGPDGGALFAARRTRAGAWRPPVRIVRSAAAGPAVAIDRRGRVTVAYRVDDGPTPWLGATVFRPGSGWSTPRRLSPTDVAVGVVQLAVGRRGDTLIAWDARALDFRHQWVQVASRTATGAWSRPRTVAGAGDSPARLAAVAVDARGRAALAWIGGCCEGGFLKVRRRTADGRWRTSVGLSPPNRQVGDVRLSVVDGDVTVAWADEVQPDSDSYRLLSRRQRPGSGWSAIRRLTASEETVGAWTMVVDPRKRATVLWRRVVPNVVSPIRVARRATDGSWGRSVELLRSGAAAHIPHVGVDDDGVVHVGWLRDRGNREASWRRFVPGRGWSGVRVLADFAHANGGVLSLSVAPGGTALLAWDSAGPIYARVRS